MAAEKEKLLHDVDRLREAGLLKRDEIAALSESNSARQSEAAHLESKIYELKQQVAALEAAQEQQSAAQVARAHSDEAESSRAQLLELETAGLRAKLELHRGQLVEYEAELAVVDEERNQLRLTLNHLNAHVGKVQDDKAVMDQDLTSLADEKVRHQRESRQWRAECSAARREAETLRIDVGALSSQLALEQAEHEKRRVELAQQEVEQRALYERVKQLAALKAEYKDLKYEAAGKQDRVERLRVELEGLRKDLLGEHAESTKHKQRVRSLSKKLDRATTHTAKLQAQIDDFEHRVTDSVARPLYNELQRELDDYKLRLRQTGQDRDALKAELARLTAAHGEQQALAARLGKEREANRDELAQLATHNTFWKNKVKSMRDEIKKLHTMPLPVHMPAATPPSASQRYVYSKSDNDANASVSGSGCDDKADDLKLARALKEKSEALAVVAQLKRALNNELHKAHTASMKHKMLASHSSEEVSSLVRKSGALKRLANELADTVADKEQNIKHHKEVLKLLGHRVTELEKANKRLRGSHEVSLLQHTHALSNGGGGGQGLAKQTILISKTHKGKGLESDCTDLP